MVRIDLINPKNLTDQHLIAEFNEILMLIGHLKKHPKAENIPKKFCLGEGHINFFKDKVLYLKKRHQKIAEEMKKRGFNPRKKVSLKGIPKKLVNDWKPSKKDKDIIKKRLIARIRKKPYFYSYYKKKKPVKFYVDMIKKSG